MLMPYDDPFTYGSADTIKQKIEELTEKKEERKVVRKRLSEKGCQKKVVRKHLIR